MPGGLRQSKVRGEQVYTSATGVEIMTSTSSSCPIWIIRTKGRARAGARVGTRGDLGVGVGLGAEKREGIISGQRSPRYSI